MADGYEAIELQLSAVAGVRQAMNVRLPVQSPPEQASQPPTVDSAPDSAAPVARVQWGREFARRGRMRRGAYALWGIGVGALVTASVAAGLATARVNMIEEKCRAQPSGKCAVTDADRREKDANLGLLSVLATAGWITAGATTASGLALFFFAPSAKGARSPQGLGLALGGRF